MSGLSVAKSLGHHGQWGFSASFDMLDALVSSLDAESDPVNILLIQPGDIRHILSTVSRRRRRRTSKSKALRPVHFYVFESTVEALARELLLLEIINDYEVPIRQRTNTFLEVYGNNKVQRRTSLYIEQLGGQLRRLISKGVGQLDNVLDFSHLRYREKDEIENALKAYSRDYIFDMNTLYDHRQRGLYEERYDRRKALFDWDYHSTIKGKASIVHIKQYKEWRESGIAFEFGDQTYTEPNKTLMSFTEGTMKKGKEKGIKKEVKGFWGDISTSPYFSFGVDCETPNKHAEGLFDIYNKNTGTEQHRHHAVEVALYNVFSVLWESETGQAYRMSKASDIYSGLGAEASILSSKLDLLDPPAPPAKESEKQQQGDEDGQLPVIETVDDEDSEKEKSEGGDKNRQQLATVNEGEEHEVEAETEEEEKLDYDFTTPDEKEEEQDEERKEKGAGSSGSAGNKSKDTKSIPEAESAATSPDDSSAAVAATKTTTPDPQNGGGASSSSSSSKLSASESREKEIAAAVLRAETIEETYKDVKVMPMTGSVNSVLSKQKYRHFFDCIYVSSRSAQVLGEDYFGPLLREDSSGAYVAVETGKFIVSLSQDLKNELLKKEVELADRAGLTQVSPAPVFRRRRDEQDTEDDVIFFRRKH